ncbi:MAG TPA: beta-ketoacyl-ACP synthase III [Bacteroidota bacterium]|nr:beta-ketoacyl-ACP synthase III [Bacteroidota bacterium]
MPKRRATITAVGHYVPDKILTNHDLEKMVDTTDEWIRTRTGIEERHILEKGGSSDLGAQAITALLKNRGMRADELDLIIVATVTPDMFFPSTACLIQEKVQAKNAWGFDVSAACSGFLFALITGAQFIETGAYQRVVVVGADKMSSITDYTDRNNCILFGDAAGAVLLEPTEDPSAGILDHILRCDGSGEATLHMRGGGSLNPSTHETVDKGMHYLYQDGKAVFKVAVVGMADVSVEIVERNGLKGKDIDWLVPHQANLRIIDATAKRMGIDKSQVMININRYGNTTAATIPLCLSEWWQSGKLRKDHKIVLAAFGAGYTWGSVLIRWTAEQQA